MIYDVHGNSYQSVYDKNKNILTAVYDIDGTMIGTLFDNSTAMTDVYTSTLTAQPQGGCIDDNQNIYTIFSDAGKFSKYNLVTGVETVYSFTGGAYGHANGMTYNPNTGLLYLASMKSTGEVYVFDTSMNLVDTLYALKGDGTPFTCWDIAYDRIRERFITMYRDVIYFMDDDFNLISTGTYNESEWTSTMQDIETDGYFIYAVGYNPNKIFVSDLNGKVIKIITNSSYPGEPEAMGYDWETGKFYIEGKSGHYIIKEVSFLTRS